jgi:hypothetical protein
VIDWHKRLATEPYATMPSGVFLESDDWAYSDSIPKVVAPTMIIAGSLEYVVEREDQLACLDALRTEEMRWSGSATPPPDLPGEAGARATEPSSRFLDLLSFNCGEKLPRPSNVRAAVVDLARC